MTEREEYIDRLQTIVKEEYYKNLEDKLNLITTKLDKVQSDTEKISRHVQLIENMWNKIKNSFSLFNKSNNIDEH